MAPENTDILYLEPTLGSTVQIVEVPRIDAAIVNNSDVVTTIENKNDNDNDVAISGDVSSSNNIQLLSPHQTLVEYEMHTVSN